jgi:hypothetical protein
VRVIDGQAPCYGALLTAHCFLLTAH